MKLSAIIKAGLAASLFMVLSGPAQSCEVISNSAHYSDTESFDSNTIARIKASFYEE